ERDDSRMDKDVTRRKHPHRQAFTEREPAECVAFEPHLEETASEVAQSAEFEIKGKFGEIPHAPYDKTQFFLKFAAQRTLGTFTQIYRAAEQAPMTRIEDAALLISQLHQVMRLADDDQCDGRIGGLQRAFAAREIVSHLSIGQTNATPVVRIRRPSASGIPSDESEMGANVSRCEPVRVENIVMRAVAVNERVLQREGVKLAGGPDGPREFPYPHG